MWPKGLELHVVAIGNTALYCTVVEDSFLASKGCPLAPKPRALSLQKRKPTRTNQKQNKTEIKREQE